MYIENEHVVKVKHYFGFADTTICYIIKLTDKIDIQHYRGTILYPTAYPFEESLIFDKDEIIKTFGICTFNEFKDVYPEYLI